MNKIITIIILLAFSTASFSQQLSQPPTYTKEEYLQKSKKQKNIAWILLGAGAAMTITAFVIPEGEETSFNPVTWQNDHKNDGIKGGLILVGALSMAASIPLFLASGRNKRRANALSAFIQMERAVVLNENHKFPALGIRIKL
jgi:hypothetical protein